MCLVNTYYHKHYHYPQQAFTAQLAAALPSVAWGTPSIPSVSSPVFTVITQAPSPQPLALDTSATPKQQNTIIIASIVVGAVAVAIVLVAIYYRHSIILKFKSSTTTSSRSPSTNPNPDLLDWEDVDDGEIHLSQGFWDTTTFDPTTTSTEPNPFAIDIKSDDTATFPVAALQVIVSSLPPLILLLLYYTNIISPLSHQPSIPYLQLALSLLHPSLCSIILVLLIIAVVVVIIPVTFSRSSVPLAMILLISTSVVRMVLKRPI